MQKSKIFPIIVRYIILLILCIPVLIPLYMMSTGSLKSVVEAARMDIQLPKQWLFENYTVVIKKGNIFRAFSNSTFVTSVSMVLTLLVSASAAFYFARSKTRGSRIMFIVYALGLIAPLSVVPTIWLMKVLHITGTYTSLIAVFCATNIPFCTFLITGYVKAIPRELDEAATIDGYSPFGLFLRIVFPLLLPVNATGAIIVFMNVWNSLIIPLYFLNTSTKWTMPLTVYNFFGQYSSSWNLVFADLVLTALPVIVFYLFCQKYIISGMVAGAVKA